MSTPLRCFLVEDNALIRENLTATLEEALPVQVLGFAVDALAALRWLAGTEAQGCDLMILDLFLQQGSGLEVLEAARGRWPAMQCVVLSNYVAPAIRQRCLALGAHRVFDKSAELDELLAYCRALTESGRS